MSNIFETAVLRVDNIPNILSFCFDDGSSIWPSLRFQLRFLYLNKDVQAGNVTQSTKPQSKFIFFRYLIHVIARGAWRNTSKTDILSIANYEGNPSCPNRMTVFLNELDFLKKRELLYSPRLVRFSSIKETYSFDYFYFKSLILRKIKKSNPSDNSLRAINEILNIIIGEFGNILSEKSIGDFKQTLLRSNELSQYYQEGITKYLQKCKPKLILCSEGNNGDWRHTILFSVAHKLGIPTSEVQHGIFNIGMRFGESLVTQKRFKNQKTDYLFTFGKFHANQTNLPSKCIPLGHYHLETAKKNLINSETKKNGKLNILFVCEGIPASAINNGLIKTTYKALKQLNKAFQLIVRLHPSESPNVKYDGFFEFKDTRYSDFKSEGIHKLLIESDIVITHASTVVYEALYFKKNPFVLEDAATSEYIPDGIGMRFKDAQDLIHGIETEAYKYNESEDKGYWAHGTVVENFRKFWKKEIEKNE